MVAYYAAHFCHVTVDAGWNEAAQLYQFCWGLQEEIIKKMAYVEMLTSLNAFTDLTIHITNRLHERRLEKWGSLQPPYQHVVPLTVCISHQTNAGGYGLSVTLP